MKGRIAAAKAKQKARHWTSGMKPYPIMEWEPDILLSKDMASPNGLWNRYTSHYLRYHLSWVAGRVTNRLGQEPEVDPRGRSRSKNNRPFLAKTARSVLPFFNGMRGKREERASQGQTGLGPTFSQVWGLTYYAISPSIFLWRPSERKDKRKLKTKLIAFNGRRVAYQRV